MEVRPKRRRLAVLLDDMTYVQTGPVDSATSSAPLPAGRGDLPSGARLTAEIAHAQATIFKFKQQMNIALSNPNLSEEQSQSIRSTAMEVISAEETRLANLRAHAVATGNRVPDLFAALASIGATETSPGAPSSSLVSPVVDVAAAAAAAVSGLASGAAAAPAPAVLLNRIYVGSLPLDVSEPIVRQVFTQVGPIQKVEMSFDPATGRSKGFCFITFDTEAAASTAVDKMNGTMIGGRNIKVSYPSGTVLPPGRAPPPSKPVYKVYVGNVPPSMTSEHLRLIFVPFGSISSCNLLPSTIPGEEGHRGYGFIEFETEDAARGAIERMNGLELDGRKLKVSFASGSTLPAGGPVSSAGASVLAMNPLMAAGMVAGVPPPPPPPPPPPHASAALASRIVALRNMVSTSGIDPSLEQDVGDECHRFGRVVGVRVVPHEPHNAHGRVTIYVEFSDPREALAAIAGLDQRRFDDRITQASFYPEQLFREGRFE